jgi:hypothetical protein
MSPNQGRPAPTNHIPAAIEGTRLESDEEIRQALQARRARLATRPQVAPPGTAARGPVAVPAEVEAQAERPVLRPPIALLCILDDGRANGEWVRLRSDVTVLGRTEGNVLIPHDGLASSRHAEIVRQRTPTGYRWLLADLQSTNGTFLRITSTILHNDNEVLIGGGRYRFEAGVAASPAAPPSTTQPWPGIAPIRSQVPSLVELSPAGPVCRHTLTRPEYWIGRDAQLCAIARPGDALVNARHARLYRDANGVWRIENNKSLNGLWLRIADPMPLGPSCQFRVGEQRFLFRVT